MLEQSQDTDKSAAAHTQWPQEARWPRGADAATGGLPLIDDAAAVAPQDARALSKLFFDRLRELEEGTAAYSYARNTLIEMNLSLVHFAAGRYRNRPATDHEEIVQVGTIGLIKAIDRFDLSRETEFTTFAVPYIVGEMKRFFRDTTWAVHVPRRLQELRVELSKAKETLSLRLDRDPTVAELAEHLGLPQQEVMEGLVAANGYTAGSIDTPYSDGDSSADGEGRTLSETFGERDRAMDLFEDFHALAPLLEQLPERSRLLLQLRFGEELTQAEIGERLGCSQMHVSRLLSRTIARLRAGMLAD
ncbi:SigB/SigF/SigG family RNA polymerase sigma factor [Streptomyces sp. PRB2-1]|jgi:RNA polymerase sigma-B factor|uniref:SigB/SigF/SigG family RNA polymerase sigma factor n=2 Tax=Actinacidiphila epipremni TaxID=2053013 RepID=A0ABX0ZY56_9ACTN|nr:SigB/SigF/SigG family RNA polymerase sigma factor [Actinacidiphila epipremni]